MEFGYRSALGAILMNTNAESRQLKKVYKNKSNAKYFSKLIGILTPTYLELMGLLTSTLYNGFIHNFSDIRKERK